MEALTNIGFVLAIFSVLFGIASIIFIGINIEALGKQNNNAIRSERNERFTNAINQLGKDNNAVVLGGIYTLHRIAQEDESYRENVFNILCSFIREVTITDEYKAKYTEKPSEPIQTILNILCINENDFKVYKEYRIDFTGANLTEANLIEANLIDANLLFTTLTLANLKGANLTRADLQEADLKGAFILNANLTGTNLGNACLKGTRSIVRTILLKSFEYYMRLGINKPTDLSGISGGYDEKNPPFKGTPIFGSYTEEDATQMIAKYYKNLK